MEFYIKYSNPYDKYITGAIMYGRKQDAYLHSRVPRNSSWYKDGFYSMRQVFKQLKVRRRL